MTFPVIEGTPADGYPSTCGVDGVTMGSSLLHSADRLVNLPPVNCDSLRVLNAQPHLVASDLDHREDDVAAKDDALVLLA